MLSPSQLITLSVLLVSTEAIPTFSGMGGGSLPSFFNGGSSGGSSSGGLSSLFGGSGSSRLSGLLGGGSGSGLSELLGGSSGLGGLSGGLSGLGGSSGGLGGLSGGLGGLSGGSGLGGLSGGSGLGGLGGLLGGGSSGLGGLGGLGSLGGGSSGTSTGSTGGSTSGSTGSGTDVFPVFSSTPTAPSTTTPNDDGHSHSHEDPPPPAASTVSAAPVSSSAPTTTTPEDDGHGHSHGGTGAPVPEITGIGPIPEGYNVEPDLDPKKITTPGSRFIEQRLGPYKIPAGGEKNFFELNVKMPCTNCWVTATQGTLEYADGSEANINTGGWLHHMVMFQRGTTGLPATGKYQCTTGIGALLGGSFSGIGGRGGGSGVFWSTGNERAVKRINGDGKFGHKILSSTSAMMTFELMNESKKDAEYYMRFVYEVVDFKAPEAQGYQGVVGIWLDVGGCTGSDVPAKEGVYKLESPVYKVSTPGRLLEASGHLHDGGTHIEILHNGKVICTPKVLYGRKPGAREAPDSEHAGMQHISDTTSCRDFGSVKAGDELKLIAYYDAVKYPQMVHHGELHPVMGISAVYMAPEKPF